LYYHQLNDESSPLSISPELFSRHLDVIVDLGVDVVTAAELADARFDRDAVVITFDDAFAEAVEHARPLLAARDMRATFFCVAGHIGGHSDWPSRLPSAPVQPLAGPDALRELARDGHEIGSHGWTHAPLDVDSDLDLELVASRDALTALTDAAVRTFAYPYGARPTAAARAAVAQTYDLAFATTVGRVAPSADPVLLPRIDAHYVRDPRLLRRVLVGACDTYLGLRRLGSRTRRAVRRDYLAVAQ
jgi:peptidoglycan/xylan/chitin deacetylase (PgdA/CDA1 family)